MFAAIEIKNQLPRFKFFYHYSHSSVKNFTSNKRQVTTCQITLMIIFLVGDDMRKSYRVMLRSLQGKRRPLLHALYLIEMEIYLSKLKLIETKESGDLY